MTWDWPARTQWRACARVQPHPSRRALLCLFVTTSPQACPSARVCQGPELVDPFDRRPGTGCRQQCRPWGHCMAPVTCWGAAHQIQPRSMHAALHSAAPAISCGLVDTAPHTIAETADEPGRLACIPEHRRLWGPLHVPERNIWDDGFFGWFPDGNDNGVHRVGAFGIRTKVGIMSVLAQPLHVLTQEPVD